jgi:SEC-C motif
MRYSPPERRHMAKTGRNELCSCGSGKKFKKCHGIKTDSQRQSKVLMIVVGGAMIAALAAVMAQVTTDNRGGPTRVWDPAHGHYHTAGGGELP